MRVVIGRLGEIGSLKDCTYNCPKPYNYIKGTHGQLF